MMKRFGGKLFLGLVIFTMLLVNANAAVGDIDTTFGTNGATTVDFNGNPTDGQSDQDSGLDMVIQPDGKIIIVGESYVATTDSVMSATRLNADGSIDTTFGDNGKFMYNVAAGIAERAYAVAVQADGKIVIAGRTNSPRDRVVIRLNSDGSFDTSFADNGIFKTPIGSPNFDEEEVAIQPDGKIIVIGAARKTGATTDSFSVMRLNTDGTFDNSFGDAGQVATNFITHDRAYGLVLQSDGKILVSGGANNNNAFALARYNTDGSLDTTFGTEGKVTTVFTGATALAYDLTLQPDGKILAAGYTRTLHSDATIVRYNTDGSVDTSFGTDGTAKFGLPNQEVFWNIYYKDGKILGTGTRNPASGSGSPDDLMLVQFNENGVLNTEFGDQGVIYTNLGQREISLTSAFQADGKFILAGYKTGSQTFNPDFLAVRYNFSNVTPKNSMDFDGDGKSDLAVYRAINGASSQWWIQKSSSNAAQSIEWGLQNDVPVAADFDGDQKTDIAVWRSTSASQATFYILNSSDNTLRQEAFGQSGDQPIVGDYDGDGKADVAVYRGGGQSYFFYRGSQNNPNGDTTYIPWGTSGDKAVIGDFNGDGKNDFTVFRNGDWWILPNGSTNHEVRHWGLSTDKLVPADYDGDGKTDVAVYRPAEGVWYIQQSSNGAAAYQSWGIATDMPVPADYDGDGKADVSVYRDGVWYILQSANGNVRYENFGNSTDTPVPAITVQ